MAFSIVIICRDEEDNIGTCLASIQGLTDDIIVVDTGSTDRTREIAATYPCTLIEKEWKGYGPTRNYANLQAKYDWILSIDADELVDDGLYEALSKWQPHSTKVYGVRRINHIGDRRIRYGHLRPESKPRLFNRLIYRWDSKPVHELLVPTVVKRNVEILNGSLLHYQEKDIESLDRRYKTYASLSLPKKGLLSQLAPYYHFVRSYIFMLGFLEGTLGCKLARSNYIYAKLKNLN